MDRSLSKGKLLEGEEQDYTLRICLTGAEVSLMQSVKRVKNNIGSLRKLFFRGTVPFYITKAELVSTLAQGR